MKKILGLVLGFGLVVSSNGLRAEVDKAALVSAFSDIALKLMSSIPKLVKDVPAFPEKIKTTMTKFKTDYKAMLKMTAGAEKDKAILGLFVLGVSLLIDVNNIADNFLGLVKEVGPVVTAIDREIGPKVDKVITDIVDIIYMFSRIAQGVQRVLIEEKGFVKPADQALVVKTPLVSDDL